MTKAERIKVSIVGKAGHAARLIELVKQHQDAVLHWVYYPKAVSTSDLPLTKNLKDVYSSDAVIIASPTPTHFDYLECLRNYNGYVLVEKPIVSTREQTEKLNQWPTERKAKIKANYNFRHSRFMEMMEDVMRKPEFGETIYFQVHTSHGLAFQHSYQDSWRSDLSQSLGVLEMVGVHFINLAIRLFGPIQESNADLEWMVSPKNKAPDTVHLKLEMKSGPIILLFHSYAGPFRNHFLLYGTNGYCEYDGIEARFYSPRDTFDTNGMFTSPPLVDSVYLGYGAAWRESLKSSIDHFINVVKGRGTFDLVDLEQALSSMEPIFQVRDHLNTIK